MISFNLLDINFINFPAGIWETTRSRSSRQRYFQIYFLCNSCKLTKHYSFVYYLLYDWPRRIRRPLLAPADWGRGGGGTVFKGLLITHSVASFFSFLSFFKVSKEFLSTTVLWVQKIKSDGSNHFWINRNSGSTFRLFPSCYISEFLCPLSYFSDNHASLTIAKISSLGLLCPAFLLCNFFKPGLGERFLLCSLATNLR